MERKINQSTPGFRRMTTPPIPPVKPSYKCKIELVLANDRVWDVYKNDEWQFSRGSWDNVVSELVKYNF